MLVTNEKDRAEILESGKRTAMLDLHLERNAEILQLWQGFAKLWNLAVRTTMTPAHSNRDSTPAVTQQATIHINRTAGIKVTALWKNKANKVVETQEIMTL